MNECVIYLNHDQLISAKLKLCLAATDFLRKNVHAFIILSSAT